MEIPTYLTIQDYFKHRGHGCRQPEKGVKAATHTGSTVSGSAFSTMLEGARASSGGQVRGLSVRDYLQRRIPSHRPAADKVSCKTRLPEPAIPSPDDAPAQQMVSSTVETHTARQPERAPMVNHRAAEQRKISASIDRAADRFGLPPALIKAVVKAESNYQVRALSPAGAQGLMQLMPATAREMGVTDPFDIDQNIQGGTKYLRRMLDQFDGDMHLALSAYNAGPGTVKKYAGNVPYTETRDYVRRVLRYVDAFSSSGVT
jgi:soluble lytic murein transglycosylase-like protein